MKFGISFTETVTISPRVTVTTVMQFGFKERQLAQQALDKSMKNIDPITEALAIFEYSEDRENELEIGNLLPADIPTIPVNLNENE